MVFFNVLLILVLGNLAPIIVASVKANADQFLHTRSREILAADLSVTGIKNLSQDQRDIIFAKTQPIKSSSEIQFMTMARSDHETMLVDVKGISENYPLFGSIQLFNQEAAGNAKSLRDQPIAWIQPDILEVLKLHLGDSIQIGQTKFEVKALISKDSVLPQASLSFAPRVYIGENWVADTKLLKFGSQIFYRLQLELKNSIQPKELAESLREKLKDPDLFIRTPQDAIEGFSRFLDFFNKYLSLITLLVFSVSWVSAFYIFQSLNQSHLKQAAILITLGATRKLISLTYLMQSIFLNSFAFLISGGIAHLVFYVLQNQFRKRLPDGFFLDVNSQSFINIYSISILTSFCFVWILIFKISRLNLQLLLGESNQSDEKLPWRDLLILQFFILVSFVLTAYFLMGSQSFAWMFVSGLILSSVLSLYFGRGVFSIFRQIMKQRSGMLRVLSIQLSRIRFAHSICFIAIALIAIVINIVPHLMSSIKRDIEPLTGHQLPSLFVFNIPEERLAELQKFVASEKKELNFVSPLILARLVAVNSKAPTQDFFLKYPVRISYRKDLIASEKIVEGEALPLDYKPGEPIFLSLDQGFSERYGFHLGDEMEFDVAGISIKARVRNLRRVRWSDFNPNFYFEFQVGVLEDAPKTWLANVQLGDDRGASSFKNQLIVRFPDVSVVDVKKSLDSISQIVEALVLPSELLSGLAAIFCLMILGFLVWHHMVSRTEEIEILKILSSRSELVLRLLLAEYMALAVCALIVGSLAGLGMASYICLRFLKLEVVFAWGSVLKSSAVFLVLMFLICNTLLSKIMSRVHANTMKS